MTDAAIAEDTSVSTEVEPAVEEAQEPTGETSDAVAAEPSGEDPPETEEEQQKKRNSFQERINQKNQTGQRGRGQGQGSRRASKAA